MIVRLAKLKDKVAVLRLLGELIDEVNIRSGESPKGLADDKMPSKLYEELAKREDVKIFVVENEGKILGVADLFIIPIMRRGYYQGHIEDFVITKDMRGKGIGSLLLEAIKDFCKKKGIKVIKLTSGLELTSAHKFYEKNGAKFTEKMYRFDL